MTGVLNVLLPALAAIAFFAVVGVGPAHRFLNVPVPAALGLFAIGGLAGLAVAAIAAVLLLLKFFAAFDVALGPHVFSLALAGGAAFMVLSFLADARGVPPIHDISTDTDNPPQFKAVTALRGPGDHPVSYDGDLMVGSTGKTVREAQLGHYKDLDPARFAARFHDVYAAALQEVEAQRWSLVDASEAEGRIEASQTTAWWGFTDDIVIRITQDGDEVRVDVRSKSRVGVSDVGANAERIEEYLAGLEARLR